MKNYFIANGEMLNTDMSIEEIESRYRNHWTNILPEWHNSESRK